jgi:hypothetical protein
MTEDLPARLARLAARYDSGNGEGEALTNEALERLAYRRRHSGKTCAVCGEDRPLSAFTTDARKPDGLGLRCNSCEARRQRERRASKRV